MAAATSHHSAVGFTLRMVQTMSSSVCPRRGWSPMNFITAGGDKATRWQSSLIPSPRQEGLPNCSTWGKQAGGGTPSGHPWGRRCGGELCPPWKVSVASLLTLLSVNSISDSWMGIWGGEGECWRSSRAHQTSRITDDATARDISRRRVAQPNKHQLCMTLPSPVRPTSHYLGEPQHLHPAGSIHPALAPTGLPKREG